MFLVTTSSYPLTQANKVTSKFQKAATASLPSFLERLHTFTTAGGEGIKVLGIYKVDDDKVADGIKELTRYFVEYYDVEGFKYIVETMLTAQEAIPLLQR
jgi:tagatose-1,6-bisphosphate aldolase